MAKLTARFDMQDKVTKKMKALQGNLESVEKSRKKLEKPMVLKAKDEATKKLQSIQKFMKKEFEKPKKLLVLLSDQASKPLNKLSYFIKRKMPKTHNLIVKAQDRAMSVLEKINRFMGRHLTKARIITIQARDRAIPTMHKIANYAKRSLAKGYNVTFRAIDIASKTVGRIASYTSRLIPKYRNFTIRAIDRATTVIGLVKNALFSIPTLITVTLGVVGAGKLKDATLGAAMNFEDYGVSMTHWLKGNQKKADQLINWMGRFADSTPFSSADLFPALSRGVGIASGNVTQAKELLKLSADMAGLMPGKTVSDAMEALADARMGEFERMKEFNITYTADKFKKTGWNGFIKQVKNAFEGGAEKLSGTGRGQLNTLMGYTSTQFRSVGEGILDRMKPRLQYINNWLDDNQDKWTEWKKTLQDAGTEGAEWVFSRLEKGFSYIRKHYLENDKFKKLNFEGKVKFIMDDLGKWWDNTGRPWLAEVSKDVGKAMFKGIVWGVEEGIKGIGNMWVDAFKNPSLDNFAGAGIATAIAASIGSLVLSPLIKGFRTIYNTGKWFYDMSKKAGGLIRKGKGPKPPTGTGGGTFRTPNNPSGRRSKPVYTQPWFNKGKKPTLNVPNKKPSMFSKGLGKGLSTIGKFGKRIPVLGTVMGGLSVMSASKKDKPRAIGSFGGSLGGAAAGASIGSVVPGVGTVIGSVLGGFGGSALGGKIGSMIDIKGITDKFNDLKTSIGNTLFSSDWWAGKWNDSLTWVEGKWGDITEGWNMFKERVGSTVFSAEWWAEKWGFAVGWAEGKWEGITETWNSFKESLRNTIFSGDWWKERWKGAVAWGSDKWQGIVETWNNFKDSLRNTIFSGDWWKNKWKGAVAWGSDKWEGIVETWNNFKDSLRKTIFSGDWWKEKWKGAVAWGSGKWQGIVETWNNFKESLRKTIFSGDWWKEKWKSAVEWGAQKWKGLKDTWEGFKSKIGNVLFNKEWWQSKWRRVADWGQQIINDTGTWFGKKMYKRMSSFNKGREKGKKAAKYANGGYINRPHLGLVGEAGPEMIIPLSSSRRGRALDLYNQTGNMLGVRPYANGGLVGGSIKKPITQPVAASLNVGSVSVQGMDKEARLYGESFTNAVASGINGNIVPISTWKKNNIETPMQGVIKQAVGYGANTVTSFSAGQNATPTNTTAYLNRQVKTPFKVIEGGASQWGSGTVAGFRSGQNATQTGTKPYLITNVHTPFNETRAKGSSWGSGTAAEFISGLRSKGGQVKEAAKYLAKQVERTFKQELGIHSPSRVMERLGEFTSLGIVKGLGAVDVKKFAEKQAGSLAAAFSGLGAVGGNVKQWIQAAMMITGVPGSWLGPLSVIAKKESGGNPRAINLWDINAKRGIPSKGLMQTINPTFNAYKKKGMNDIWNPIHNVVAAINYIKSRYGSVFNVPGIKSMARGGAYRGYWKGTKGPLRSAETAWVGERGPELVHLPRGTEVYSHNESKRLADSQVSAAMGTSGNRSSSSPNKSIVVQITGDNHFNNDADMDNFTEKIKKVLEDVLRDEYNEGGELVVYD